MPLIDVAKEYPRKRDIYTDVGLVLGQRNRRWPYTKTTLVWSLC